MAAFVRICILCSLALLLVYLIITRELNTYINPRFQYLTIFSFVVLLILSWIQRKHYRKRSIHPIGVWGYVAVGLPIVLFLLFPGKPSDASLANQKVLTYVSPNQAVQQEKEDNNKPSEANTTDIDKQKVAAFLKEPILVLTNENYIEVTNLMMTYPEQFKGKIVRTEGFVYREENFSTNKFVIARLALACCVADAGVVGFLIESSTAKTLKNDHWLQVEGTFELKKTELGEVPVLQLLNYKKIAPPKDSYIYQSI